MHSIVIWDEPDIAGIREGDEGAEEADECAVDRVQSVEDLDVTPRNKVDLGAVDGKLAALSETSEDVAAAKDLEVEGATNLNEKEPAPLETSEEMEAPAGPNAVCAGKSDEVRRSLSPKSSVDSPKSTRAAIADRVAAKRQLIREVSGSGAR